MKTPFHRADHRLEGGPSQPLMTVGNFTHYLECSHCFGPHRRRYWMKCHALGLTKGGKMKVQVYGRLYWGGEESRIRYVDPVSVSPKENFIK